MFDHTSTKTFRGALYWITCVTNAIKTNTQTVVCGNKSDNKGVEIGMIPSSYIDDIVKPLYPYYDVSAKNNQNLDAPWLHLARKLTGQPNLEFIESPPIIPPEVKVTPSYPQVNWVKVPGGRVKVTHEFFADEQ
jgi:GTP-binding nuclear protein Ran